MPTTLDEKEDSPTLVSDSPLSSSLGFVEPKRLDPVRLDRRLLEGMRYRQNWIQLFLFAVVGASGFFVNMAVFSLLDKVGHLHYGVAATCAFIVALANNFFWNRRYTFAASDGHAGFQAARFVTISILAFLFSFGVLNALVLMVGIPRVPAQAISLIVGTPF